MHEMQAAGATAVINGWDQDVVPATSEHSTDSMRSSRHAGAVCFAHFLALVVTELAFLSRSMRLDMSRPDSVYSSSCIHALTTQPRPFLVLHDLSLTSTEEISAQ